MKHKEYKKLMKTPFEELSEQDQKKRTIEFKRRLEAAKTFITGLTKGYINDDIDKLIEDDDPIKDTVELVKLQINEVNGES
jgi:RNA binding exosome subunit